jgi:hypothetical protein
MMIVYVFVGLILLAIIVPLFSGGADSSIPQNASLKLLNVYFLGNNQATTDWYRITELENTGKTRITAFQGKWTIKDDLGATVAEQEIRFTSDTIYLPPKGDKSPNVIAPGEKFVIINKNDSSVDSDFASTKENLTNCIYGYAQFMQLAPLENCRVTKKITFELEKCITQ